MQVGPHLGSRRDDVHRMMVIERVRTHQGVDHAFDLR